MIDLFYYKLKTPKKSPSLMYYHAVMYIDCTYEGSTFINYLSSSESGNYGTQSCASAKNETTWPTDSLEPQVGMANFFGV